MKLFNTKSALAALLLAATVTSCDMDDFGEINQNPNRPSVAYTSMLFTYSATYLRNFISLERVTLQSLRIISMETLILQLALILQTIIAMPSRTSIRLLR